MPRTRRPARSRCGSTRRHRGRGAAAEDPGLPAGIADGASTASNRPAGPRGRSRADVRRRATARRRDPPPRPRPRRVADDSGRAGGSQRRGSGGTPGASAAVVPTVDPLGLLGTVRRPVRSASSGRTPVMVTTTGTVVVWAAFVFFGKRRRDGEPPAPDPVLAAHAAAAHEPIPVAEPSCRRSPPATCHPASTRPRPDCPAGVARRCSRPARPIRSGSAVTAFTSLTFADGAVEPYDGSSDAGSATGWCACWTCPTRFALNEIADPRRGRRGPGHRRLRRLPARALSRRPGGLAPPDGPRRRRASTMTRPSSPRTGSTRTSCSPSSTPAPAIGVIAPSPRRQRSRRRTRMCWWAMFGTNAFG